MKNQNNIRLVKDNDVPVFDDHDVIEFRKKRRFDEMFYSILKEVFIFAVFYTILLMISYYNISNSAFQYNQLFISTFVDPQNSNEIGLNDVN